VKRYRRYAFKEGVFLTLLGLLLALLVIAFILYYVIFNVYFSKSSLDEKTKKSLSEQDIRTSSPRVILDSAREAVQDFDRGVMRRQKEYDKWGK